MDDWLEVQALAREHEKAVAAVPDEGLDALPACRLPMDERSRGLVRQAIREHLAEQADPALRQALEGGRRGRPRSPTCWLEHDLFAILCAIGPKAPDGPLRHDLGDAGRHQVIAETCTALGHPTTEKAVKGRLAAGRKYAREHPGSTGPPVHLGVSATERAEATRRGIAEQREAEKRRRPLRRRE